MDCEDMPPLEESVDIQASELDSSSSDDTDNEIEMLVEEEQTTCLFCEKMFKAVEPAMEHIHKEHKISFSQLKSKFHMDQYSFIKLINCIRFVGVTAEVLESANECFWNDEKYLKPKEYEPWLSYDYDELPCEIREPQPKDSQEDLHQLIHTLRQKLKDQTEDMAKMRLTFQRIVTTDNSVEIEEEKRCVSAVPVRADENYFSSYAHFGIHHEMLSDVVRTTSYRDALLLNKEFMSGKDVLDVGCGTAVLSIFASQAGAKTVVGIDNSEIIYNAMDIVKKNNLQNVTLIKGRLENTELPQQKFDVIISEWMGYFLLFEGMLDSIIYARENHLKEGGILLPNRCTMSLIGYGSDELYKRHVSFWNDVYGLDMSNMRKEVLHEPLIDVVDSNYTLTEANTIADLNMSTVDINYSNFTYNFHLKCTRDGDLSAFVGYFDTYFDLPQPVMFGTAPTDKPTHWKQVVFFIEKPRTVKAGDAVNGKLVCKRSANSLRSLDVNIEVFGKKFTYYLD